MTTRATTSDGGALMPIGRGNVPPDAPATRQWAGELVARARAEGVELTGDGGLLTGLVRQVLQTGLEVELADHLGYELSFPGLADDVRPTGEAPSAKLKHGIG
jgi:putative transposase